MMEGSLKKIIISFNMKFRYAVIIVDNLIKLLFTHVQCYNFLSSVHAYCTVQHIILRAVYFVDFTSLFHYYSIL